MKPTEDAKQEALKHPNGWVYVIDEQFAKNDTVAPEAIKGAWPVNKYGVIEGDFLPNPHYKSD